MDKIKTDKGTLQQFGLIMAVCFAVIALAAFLGHKCSTAPASVVALAFLLAAVIAPTLLKYPYLAWMKLAFILGWLNTRLLLFIIFYFIFSPIGLVMRLFRIDLLEREFNQTQNSYWKRKEKKDFLPSDYERQS